MDGQELAKQTLDHVPQPSANAKRIVGLVKEGGRITGYKLSDETFVSKPEAVSMAKQGQIAGVGIAHRGDTECLKSIPDGTEKTIWEICPLFPRSKRCKLRPPVFVMKTGGFREEKSENWIISTRQIRNPAW